MKREWFGFFQANDLIISNRFWNQQTRDRYIFRAMKRDDKCIPRVLYYKETKTEIQTELNNRLIIVEWMTEKPKIKCE